MDQERNTRKLKKGTVLSDKMDKTVVVQVQSTVMHPRYHKVLTRNKKFYAHCEGDKPKVGSTVTIMETRPLSKLKRWRVVA